jgi:hypothetical protein
VFGMKPARTDLPPMTLTAVVVCGKEIFKKKLPLHAMNAAIFQIFTPENLEAMKRFPDATEER